MPKFKVKTLKVISVILIMIMFSVGCAGEAAEKPGVSTNPSNAVTDGGTKPSDTAAGETENKAISFSDPVFEKLLKAELKKDEILPSDLEKFTWIGIGGDHFMQLAGGDIKAKSIILFFGTEVELEGVRYKGFGTMKTLDDLKHFKNLNAINVTLQPELDFSTIPEDVLGRLVNIIVTQSKLKDISFVKNAKSLKSMNMAFGEVSDLSPLANCKELLYLSGSNNPLNDLSPLADLINLKTISFYSSQIKDLTPLSGLVNLKTLELYNNQVEDISPLAGLKNLKELELIDNKVKDVSPLKDFESFDELRLNGNPIENIELLDHIENLEFEG
ncbi:leucine-rich repeat domain-containing protein [Youngiibacter multivorans]|uniref:Leucine-rich repeat (LRR) protein n=1 Tax=Youngiibacter multivorans TaxID=937251 RepID=A0ABS4G197_9CLOT|nr:leucine-rich repeat domain-containing protein [Youngiibacter multivorans]MBP1918310.1 Leucine-rich repeat (LRR) protein [Youngiibacter multivorans]